MRNPIGDTETRAQEQAKEATERLLSLLIEHHGQGEIRATDEQQAQLLERQFVPVDADQEEAEPLEVCILPINDSPPTIEGIKRVVCRHYGVSHADILSDRRTANVVRPRQVAMYLCKELTLRSLPEIGRRFGGRDHTTVLHAVRKIAHLATLSTNYVASDIETLRAQLA